LEMLMPVYEGPEKRLEIILSAPMPGLRSDADGRWKKVIKATRAEILSRISADFTDAYLLSESSFFVWEDPMLLITCGKTAPVRALPLVADLVGKNRIAFVFYEQRNFSPGHFSEFEKDVAEISRWFAGKSYTLGSGDHQVNLFHSFPAAEKVQKPPDLQMLMYDLPAGVRKRFCRNRNVGKSEMRTLSGLNVLFDSGMMTDDHLFSPCGYSLNGIRGKQYVTVHVTPQPVNSYVSFETDIVKTGWQQVVRNVLKIFRPAEFSLMLSPCAEKGNPCFSETVEHTAEEYLPADRTLYEFDCGYRMLFLRACLKGKNAAHHCVSLCG